MRLRRLSSPQWRKCGGDSDDPKIVHLNDSTTQTPDPSRGRRTRHETHTLWLWVETLTLLFLSDSLKRQLALEHVLLKAFSCMNTQEPTQSQKQVSVRKGMLFTGFSTENPLEVRVRKMWVENGPTGLQSSSNLLSVDSNAIDRQASRQTLTSCN